MSNWSPLRSETKAMRSGSTGNAGSGGHRNIALGGCSCHGLVVVVGLRARHENAFAVNRSTTRLDTPGKGELRDPVAILICPDSDKLLGHLHPNNRLIRSDDHLLQRAGDGRDVCLRNNGCLSLGDPGPARHPLGLFPLRPR